MLSGIFNVDLEPSVAVKAVASFNNWMCRRLLFFPKWMTDNDVVLHHTSDKVQLVENLTCTMFVHLIPTFIMTTAVDFGIVRPFVGWLRRSPLVGAPWYDKYGDPVAPRSSSAAAAEAEKASADSVASAASPMPFSPRETQQSVSRSIINYFRGGTKLSAYGSESQETNVRGDAKNSEDDNNNNNKNNDEDIRKTSWFLLHVIFNGVVVAVSLKEAWHQALNPTALFPLRADGTMWRGSAPGGLLGAILIGGFHLQHTLLYTDLLDMTDIVHHAVNAGGVCALGVWCTWGGGGVESLSNIVMSGFPGAISYTSMFLWREGLMQRLTYMQINRMMNILIRQPVQLMAHYIGLLSLAHGRFPPGASFFERSIMFMGGLAHSANALYFADQVVGSYHRDARAQAERLAKKKAGEKKDSEKDEVAPAAVQQ